MANPDGAVRVMLLALHVVVGPLTCITGLIGLVENVKVTGSDGRLLQVPSPTVTEYSPFVVTRICCVVDPLDQV